MTYYGNNSKQRIMKTAFYTALIIFLAGLCVPAQDSNVKKTGSVNIEIHEFTSKVFSNKRAIRVLLPPNYHEGKNREKSYPVLYLNDGIMVFRGINLEETVHRLINDGDIQPLIVVGIDNGASTDKTKNPASDRANEFLPYPDVGFPPDKL
jgi:enterochelin esterase-like enzyme